MVFSQQGDARRRALNAGTTANTSGLLLDGEIQGDRGSYGRPAAATKHGGQAWKLQIDRPAGAAAAAANNGS